MKRYWLAFAMVLAPCLALGGWAGWEYVSRWNQDESAMRVGWRALAHDAARVELRERLERVRAAAAAYPRAGAATKLVSPDPDGPADLVFAVDGDGVRPSIAVSSSEGPLAWSVALDEARRAEFVGGDPAAAERAYRAILASSPTPAVACEAEAGLVSAIAARGDAAAALSELRSALARPRAIAAEQGAALALSLSAQSVPRTECAATLLLAYERILALPKEAALQARVAEVLSAKADALDAAGRERWRTLGALIELDGRAREEFIAFTPDDRQWIAARTAGDASAAPYRRLASGEIAYAAMQGEGVAVVAVLAEERLAREIGDALRSQPGLQALADAYARRYGKPIDESGDVTAIDAPWGRELRIATAAAGAGGASPLLAHLPALAFVACALALALAGLAFLYRTTRRDLRLAQLKSDFVSNVSHEMKTPLSLVRMFGEMLSLGYERDAEERRRYHQLIVQESQRLGMLVNNVLDVAAIEKGGKRFERVPLDFVALTAEVIETYREQLAAEGFVLDLDLAQPGPTVSGDRDALKQVVLNLLSNAMKYSREERRVSVSVRAEGGEAVLAVADRGIGIDPAEHARIFEQFYRVESGLTRETRGAGLGLSLVRSIVAALGGRVAVDSALGRGSVFSVRMPLAGTPAP